MYCPACQTILEERSANCPACAFSLQRANRLFGEVPPLHPELTDPGYVLKGLGIRKVLREIGRFHREVPQARISVVLLEVPKDVDPAVFNFWLFNRSDVCREADRGGLNRNFLLLIDTANRRANLMAGYGLEPFVNRGFLTHCITAGETALAKGNFKETCLMIMAELREQTHALTEMLPEIYGMRSPAAVV